MVFPVKGQPAKKGEQPQAAPEATIENSILLDPEKQQLREIADYTRGNTGKSGVTLLFLGTGASRSLAAEALANELHMKLYRVRLPAVISKYIGETEKNLSKIFEKAEAGGAILFFDEADALFGKRTEVKDSHDRESESVADCLVRRMEAYSGVSILAANTAVEPGTLIQRMRFIMKFSWAKAPAAAECNGEPPIG